MSVYVLQKLIRDVNRKPTLPRGLFPVAGEVCRGLRSDPTERDALLRFDVRELYEMGVHGLLLRPFTIMHKMPDPEYVKAIRGE